MDTQTPRIKPIFIRSFIARPIIWASQRIAITPAVVFGIFMFISSVALVYLTIQNVLTPRDLWLSIGTSLATVAFTMLIVDQIYIREANKVELRRLIRELASQDHAAVMKAVRELRGHDWDRKQLQRVNLARANLDGIRLGIPSFKGSDLSNIRMRNARFILLDLCDTCLYRADLSNCDAGLSARLENAMMAEANLSGASGFGEAELRKAHSLWGATLPDGSLYKGQYELMGDKEMAAKCAVDPQDQSEMAEWYTYTPERSQQWETEAMRWGWLFFAKQAGWHYRLENWTYGRPGDSG